MSNPYYTASGIPAAQTRGISSSVRGEYSSIQTGFDAVYLYIGTTLPTALLLKGNVAGQIWTGAHDFTGGTITVPTATLAAQAVNYAQLTATAFSAALPAQAGNAGSVVYTNGAIAAWTGAGVSGQSLVSNGTAAPTWGYTGVAVVGATVTANYTILTTTPTIWPCVTTAIGQCLTAPAITTGVAKGLFAVIDNSANGYPVGWRDSTGALVGKNCVAAGGIGQVYLEDNSTAAGAWRITGNNLEPGLITVDSTFSSTYPSTVLAPFVALDANTSIHFAATAAGFTAFVVDNLGKVLTTPVTLSTGLGVVSPYTAFKVSATSAIVFYNSGAGPMAGVILTVSGTSPSLTLSVGTQFNAPSTNAAAGSGENFINAPKFAALTATLYLYSCAASNTTQVLACSVSGATITWSASATNIITSSSVADSTTTYPLTATTGLVLYKSGAAAPYANNAVVISVSGVTCTVGTPVDTLLPSTLTAPPISCLLTATKAIISDDNNVNNVAKAVAITIASTVVTAGAVLQVEAVANTVTGLIYTQDGATRNNPHLYPLTTTTALLWYFDSSGISRAVVITESSGTLSKGTIAYKSISAAAATAGGAGMILQQGATEFVSLFSDNLVPANTFCQKTVLVANKISGTTITQGASKSVGESLSIALGNYVTASKLSGGTYVIHGSSTPLSQAIGGSGMTVFSSNGDAIKFGGVISVPQMVYGNGNAGLQTPCAVSANRIVALGSTYHGTTVGPTTYQLRLLNVEIAQ